ncbi:MAG TPA: hypothetical protein VLJ62_21085 [Burkholderiaceae bacterium]|nr:hypothetical protein [Burkholderiaceae bacterium]
MIVVMPRLGTVSPWASKATDIAHNCALPVRRIERVTEYRLLLEGGNALSTFRAQGLLARLAEACPRIVGISARYVHWVWSDDGGMRSHTGSSDAAFYERARPPPAAAGPLEINSSNDDEALAVLCDVQGLIGQRCRNLRVQHQYRAPIAVEVLVAVSFLVERGRQTAAV